MPGLVQGNQMYTYVLCVCCVCPHDVCKVVLEEAVIFSG